MDEVMHEHVDPIALKKDAWSIFLRIRTKEEVRMNNWKTKLLTCSERVISQLPFNPNDISLKYFVPAAYEDELDGDIIREQCKKANAIIEEVNVIMDKLNRKGCALVDEYNKLNGDA